MVASLDRAIAAEQIVEAGRRMYRFGLIVAHDGNLSARIGEGRFLASPAGCCKGELRTDDLVEVGPGGQPLGPGRPSTELAMHLAIYRRRADVAAVVHGHPAHATAFAAAGRSLDECLLPEVIVSLGRVPLSDYATPSTAELPRAVDGLIAEHDAILLRNHGVLTVGKSVLEAYHRLETVEHLARITLLAELAGGTRPLDAEQVEKLLQIRSVYGLDRPVPSCRVAEEGHDADPASGPQFVRSGGSMQARFARIVAEEIDHALRESAARSDELR